jgi:hypothetical protein
MLARKGYPAGLAFSVVKDALAARAADAIGSDGTAGAWVRDCGQVEGWGDPDSSGDLLPELDDER